MKKINRRAVAILMIFVVVFTITPSFFILPLTVQTTSSSDILEDQESMPKISQFIPRTIRVAIYNEPNVTIPSYASVGWLNNSYADLKTLLEGQGYQVDELTLSDIKAHKLMTADYDIFIMVDNLPREGITNLVKEFWLGGGGIMSFDSAISYICYAGMIPPESEGSENYGVYWHYSPWVTESNITIRHPITKEYQIGDIIIEPSLDWGAFDWAALMTSPSASDFEKLATKFGYPNLATVVAHDPSKRGGRVVQMFGDGDDGGSIGGNRQDIIIDAVEWLCPRPKARILFDLSHAPYYGVDLWDYLYVSVVNKFSEWRNTIVNKSYTFDKLYPTAFADLNSTNLAPYDLLIVAGPTIDFTAGEILDVSQWVNQGGSLLVLGDRPGGSWNIYINNLLSNFDLSMNLAADPGTLGSISYMVMHPITEACSALYVNWPGLIDYSGNAYPIWGIDVNNIIVAGQEFGKGRIILCADNNVLDNSHIGLDDNRQNSVNMVNWLTAARANVLIYVDNSGSFIDPNYNPYKGPVATALNDLGISFYLTFSIEYFNLSLHQETWKLVIIDSSYYGMFYSNFDELVDALISHVENGGCLIMSSWEYFRPGVNHLWDYFGFQYAGNLFYTPPTIYVWDDTHNIFNYPAPYSDDHIDTALNLVNIDCANLTVHNNATAIGGLTISQSDDGAAIIIGGYGRVITNAMLLTTYYDDTDDSTYPDALEIWENEIMFMVYQTLSVDVISPVDGQVFGLIAPDYEINISGYKITACWYTINDSQNYPIPPSLMGVINQTEWDTLPVGSVSLKFYVQDIYGQQKFKEVIVEKLSKSITVTSPDSLSSWETGTTHSITWTSTGSISNVKIELYKDGVFELEIIASTPNDGVFPWTIPTGLDNSTLYQIKITDVSAASVFDYSDYFEIYTLPIPVDSITVTSPDSLSSWETGTTHSITWTSTGSISNVKIELYKDGVFELEIIASTPNDGTFSWSIPTGLDNSTSYQIKITDVSAASVFDYSENFEIYTLPDSIEVTNPDSTVVWETETTHSITWTSTGSISSVKIELYKDGVLELEIVASTPNDGEYSWTIPSELEDSILYYIKISDVSTPSTYDESEFFTITRVSVPKPSPGIPSYNLMILIGSLVAVSIVLIKKRVIKN